MDLAIASGASGAVRQIEALALAETCARLAAASEGSVEVRALVGVLLARAEFEARRDAPQNAQWYEDEARRLLKVLIGKGDEAAARWLDELGEFADADHSGPNAEAIANITAAASGDLTALASFREEAMRLLFANGANPMEALTVAEFYARLGAVSGQIEHVHGLAVILLERADFEYAEGSAAVGNSAVIEAGALLIDAAEADEAVSEWLCSVLGNLHRRTIAMTIIWCATLLKFVEPKGTC